MNPTPRTRDRLVQILSAALSAWRDFVNPKLSIPDCERAVDILIERFGLAVTDEVVTLLVDGASVGVILGYIRSCGHDSSQLFSKYGALRELRIFRKATIDCAIEADGATLADGRWVSLFPRSQTGSRRILAELARANIQTTV